MKDRGGFFLRPAPRFALSLALAAGALVLLAVFLLWGRPIRFSGPDNRVLFEVPENATAHRVIRDLHDEGLIDFPVVMKILLRATGWERTLRAGYYYLSPRNSVMEIARKLTTGSMATRVITIPEGKASWEIFDILKGFFPLDSLVFDSLVRSPEFAESLGLEAPGLEGYLYPDTYVAPWRLGEQEILRLMVSRFHVVASGMDLENEFVRTHGIHGWVTLASIVEKEAGTQREQRLIAGVFHNRLREGWSLGADPTVRYALRNLTGPLGKAELAVNSPYNTRRFPGLPPGPICNPGEAALKATLNPENTRMMFFVARDDGSREHYFSATYAEHNRLKEVAAENRRRYREMLEARELLEREDSLSADAQAPGSGVPPASDPPPAR